MQTENEPARGPQKQIVLALNGVDVREKARHEERGDQQRQGNEALMHQSHIQFSAPQSGRAWVSPEDAESPCFALCRRVPAFRAKGQPYGDAKSCAKPQNKVLVIMDYGILKKQVYRGTGCQRDSMARVTETVENESGTPEFAKLIGSNRPVGRKPVPSLH
jgi:hypothetical protein